MESQLRCPRGQRKSRRTKQAPETVIQVYGQQVAPPADHREILHTVTVDICDGNTPRAQWCCEINRVDKVDGFKSAPQYNQFARASVERNRYWKQCRFLAAQHDLGSAPTADIVQS